MQDDEAKAERNSGPLVEVIDVEGDPVIEGEDSPTKFITDEEWVTGTKSCRTRLRRALSRLSPDWSRVPESGRPEYVKYIPHLRNSPYVRPDEPAKLAKYERRKLVDEVVDRIMHIMFCGSDENALKAAKIIFDSVDPPMKQSLSVDVQGAKLLVVPDDVAEAI